MRGESVLGERDELCRTIASWALPASADRIPSRGR